MKKVLIVFSVVITMVFLVFFIYVSDYYKASEYVYDLLDDSVLVNDDYIHLKSESEEGIIIYPGGKVSYESYLPLADKLRDAGFNVYLVKMPFNLGILDVNKADDIINNYDLAKWYMMGHSLGGTSASIYASSNIEKIDGLFLLGAYNYDNYPLDKTLTLIGEYDLVLDEISYNTNVYYIEGGNHAYFGDYGKQSGDGEATISNDEQQNIVVEYVLSFLN